MVDENLIKDKSHIYGNLQPEQAYQKYLEIYAHTDEVWAEFIIVYATPYFLGKQVYITQHQTLKQFEEAKNRTPKQAMAAYEKQPKWWTYGTDIPPSHIPITLAKTHNHYQSIVPISDKHTCCRGCAETYPPGLAMAEHLQSNKVCHGLYSSSEIDKIKICKGEKDKLPVNPKKRQTESPTSDQGCSSGYSLN